MSQRKKKADTGHALLDLAAVHPGDVLLEEGMAAVANKTAIGGNAFGHASLALGRLVRIHALGAGEASSVQLFDIATWRRRMNGEVIVAARVDRPAAILRPRFTVTEGDLYSEAQWEAGYPYADREKLARLNGIPTLYKALLTSPVGAQMLARVTRGNVTPTTDGRSCGELVARILHLQKPEVTPNRLAQEASLQVVDGVLFDADEFEIIGIPRHKKELDRTILNYEQDSSRWAWQRLLEEAEKRRSNPDAVLEDSDFIDWLDNELVGTLTNNASVLAEIRSLEDCVFNHRHDPL